MPSPLKNAERGRDTQTFSPTNLLKLRVRFNRSLPSTIETIADILADPEALRSLDLLEGDPNYDEAFVESIREKQTTPALVRPLPPNKEFWEVFAGCRRATAIALINARAEREARENGETIPPGLSLTAFRHDVNDKEAFKLALRENLQSKDLTVIDKANWARNSERFGLSRAEAARELGITVSTLGHWLSFLTAPHRAQELIISGVMTQEVALHALASMDEAGIDRLCERLEEGATHPDPAAAKEITKSAKQSAKIAKRATGGKLSRTPADMRKELKASGASGTDMGKLFLEYMAGERDVEDVGWCMIGDTYDPPSPPETETESGVADGPSGGYELRSGKAVLIGTAP